MPAGNCYERDFDIAVTCYAWLYCFKRHRIDTCRQIIKRIKRIPGSLLCTRRQQVLLVNFWLARRRSRCFANISSELLRNRFFVTAFQQKVYRCVVYLLSAELVRRWFMGPFCYKIYFFSRSHCTFSFSALMADNLKN
jgi:hypothetical protein